ncbi:uncharacterized protein MYCFIDRAFT_179627 [Pseudocercospora fijiensis CIRAD86]|uniref:Uncharacterized protein n=1 Tax=Pseudocercospora fijiensis (strain CIRAD86) TaxID=383855 RepID=M2ZGE0_PSEFD|nr:uncharacterized protein MYCFIDRAFT_179627 [Pseudocercospora fijiensis CIRAD86]EME78189.1 hypothetical protein MYCFIDRAFT_179627 [Pseudocercospora fijiensis CIRAD86]
MSPRRLGYVKAQRWLIKRQEMVCPKQLKSSIDHSRQSRSLAFIHSVGMSQIHWAIRTDHRVTRGNRRISPRLLMPLQLPLQR